MKKVLALIITLTLLCGAIPAYASTTDELLDACLEGFREKWEKAERDDGPRETGLAWDGTPVYEEVPKITDEHVKLALDKTIKNQRELLKGVIEKYNPFSTKEKEELVKVARESLEKESKDAQFQWIKVKDTLEIALDFHKLKTSKAVEDWITDSRKKAEMQEYEKSRKAGDPSAWAVEKVEFARSKGYVPKHLQSNYQQPITREEFAELFVTAIIEGFNSGYAGYSDADTTYWPEKELSIDYFLKQVKFDFPFTDTKNPYVKAAYVIGITGGISDHEFAPEATITREQAAKMFMNYFQLFVSHNNANTRKVADLDAVSDWAREDVVRVVSAGSLLNGKRKEFKTVTSPIGDEYEELVATYFEPKDLITREEAITVIGRAIGDLTVPTLLIRKIVPIGMQHIHCGIEVDANFVKLVNSGYEDYMSLRYRTTFYTQEALDKYAGKISYEAAVASGFTFGTGEEYLSGLERLSKNEPIKYETAIAIYTQQPKDSDYLAIVEVKPYTGYLVADLGGIRLNGQYLKAKIIE